VTTGEAEALCDELKIDMYRECSALTTEGIDELFEDATRLAIAGFMPQPTNDKCTVM
jgi:hypothetical protein